MNNKLVSLIVLFLAHGASACMPFEGNYPIQRRWQNPISAKQEAIVDRLFSQPLALLAESCAEQENHSLNNVLLERVGHYKNRSEYNQFKDMLYRSLAKTFLITQVFRLKDPAEIISGYITEQEWAYYTPVSRPVITMHDEETRQTIRQAIQRFDDPEQLPKRLKSTM